METNLLRTGVIALIVITANLGLCATQTDAKDLRTRAKAFLAPLPEKMPGAEKDTPAQVALGKKLYFEKKLSINNSQSCNDCHRVDGNRAGVDNEATSAGAHGKRGDRNSPTTLNAGFHFAQFWDGRAKTLEEQAKGPVLNPVEMAMPDEKTVVDRLATDPEYPNMFKAAFPGQANPMTYDNFAAAVSAFERTLISRDRVDDFLNGDDKALGPKELRGLDLFLTTGCTTCHTGPAIGANMYQKIGLIHRYANTNDLGRFKVTQEEGDEYRFKVPSLRNISMTAPYFHDGKAATLSSAAQQMAYMQLDKQLTDEMVADLTAFLGALSDKIRAPSRPQ
jgi:cytochrome c peroxidase